MLFVILQSHIFTAYSCKYVQTTAIGQAWGSVVVKALRYKLEGPGVDSQCCRGFFPCALVSTQPLKTSTRFILGVEAAGA